MALPAPASTRIATVFGIGFMPFAPGTLASLAALPVGWWIATLGQWPTLFAVTLAVTLLGIWASGQHAKTMGLNDPSDCVIDEVAGQWFALVIVAALGMLHHPVVLAIAFLMFRALDILKPWPISRFEKYPGGYGIMLDDVVAGLAAGAFIAGGVALHLIQ